MRKGWGGRECQGESGGGGGGGGRGGGPGPLEKPLVLLV